MTEEGLYSGKITIKSKNSQFKVSLPYTATVLRGRLAFNESTTRFHLRDEDEGDADAARRATERNLTVRNEFSVPVVVHSADLRKDAAAMVDLRGFKLPAVLRPGERRVLGQVVLKKESWKTRLLDSEVTLRTNVSDVVVPILVFHGKLAPVRARQIRRRNMQQLFNLKSFCFLDSCVLPPSFSTSVHHDNYLAGEPLTPRPGSRPVPVHRTQTRKEGDKESGKV